MESSSDLNKLLNIWNLRPSLEDTIYDFKYTNVQIDRKYI